MSAQATEVWTITSARGAARYWTYSCAVGRAIPVKRAEAELGLMAGTHFIGTKPIWVGKANDIGTLPRIAA